MRKYCLFILFLCLSGGIFAAKNAIPVTYNLRFTSGWLNRDDKIAGTNNMTGLSMDREAVMGATFAVEFLPTDRTPWLREWNNASIGLAAGYLNLGNDQYLGSVMPLYTYINVPLVHTPHFLFGIRPGFGVAFATRRYANTVPDDLRWKAYQVASPGGDKPNQQVANISIGSVVNAFMCGEVYMDFPIRDGWAVTLSGGWQHVSNGSIMTPNGGYNMFNAQLGVAYTPDYAAPEATYPRHTSLYDGVEKPWAIELGGMAGVRSVYYRDRTFFSVADLTLAGYWQPVSIFRLGLGVDAFYDGAYAAVCDEFASLPGNESASVTYFGKTFLKNSDPDRCWRVGISLQPEMVLGHLTIGYHIGCYLFDPVKNLEPYKDAAAADAAGKPLNRGVIYGYDPLRASTYQDGWFYQRVSLKYHLPYHLYVQLGLKLHIMKAEFLAAGLGVYL